MTSKLEQVARALQEQLPKGAYLTPPDYWLMMARAAIAAMELPTEEMVEERVREAILNLKAQQRMAFRKALAELPEIAPPEVRSVLSSVHMQDEFHREGKRLQREFGTDAVAPRVEQECGAGAWSFMRQGVRAALKEEK